MAQQIDPVLNIALNDNTNLLESPPSILLYGPPGAGKTTIGALAFPNMLWLTSSPTGLRSVASYLRDHPDEVKSKNLKVPNFKYLPRYGADGATKINVRDSIREIVSRVCNACAAGSFQYDGLAFDEYSELLKHVYEDIKLDPGYGKNAFAKIDALKEFNSWINEVPRITKKASLLIAHDQPPKYDEDENSPTFRQLLVKGGPTMPIAQERTSMAAAADVCIRIQLRSVGTSTKRSIMAQANALWETKFRDGLIKEEEPNVDLRELLTRAGYKL